MFCYQCEQTLKGTGCVDVGVCGKDASTAALQDLLLHVTKGVSMVAHRARKVGVVDSQVDRFVIEALFTTVTNVNFHVVRLEEMIDQAIDLRERMRLAYEAAGGAEPLFGPATWTPADDVDAMIRQGRGVGLLARFPSEGSDISGLLELLTYGLKGAAAYAEHAARLDEEDPALYAAFHEAMDVLTRGITDAGELLGWCLKTGEINLRAMELLDKANTTAYGHPEPTPVRIHPIAGKAIVVSGHDLKDLELLLQQTEGKGINVYTHGEMLPAHGYPKLKAYKHLVGNYGGPWQVQVEEFSEFPGAVLMTTNCIQRPKDSYVDRIFTSGMVAWPGVQHVSDGDFTPVIEAALAAPGFAEDGPDKTILVGFGRQAVLGVADKVVEAVKSGALRHFFLIGGCDGARPGRDYYAQLAQSVPDDCIILTLACGKYRFNKMDFGTVAGLPRLLDIGQCNDAYSAIQIAAALAGAFDCGINDLPLSLVLSWYEQKAVAILLTLLHLGVRNVRIGPTLPAFLTPNLINILVEKYNVMPITTPQEDLAAILG